jgi:MarR family transcriptional regulator, lower aerobic nicotinate degradation pathway regulator
MDALKSGDLTDDLAGHPGYLIRRAQQLSVALFTEAFGHNRVTPTQALCLQVILRRPGVDQMTVARLIDIDHATAAMVIATLEKSGYITRKIDPKDRRRRTLTTTRKGTALVKSMGPLQRSADQLLSVFNAKDAATFVRLLTQFVEGHA